MATYRFLNGRALKPWYSIDIEQEGDTKKVFFNSKIHTNPRHEVTFSFSSSYMNHEILSDSTLINYLHQRFGKDIT